MDKLKYDELHTLVQSKGFKRRDPSKSSEGAAHEPPVGSAGPQHMLRCVTWVADGTGCVLEHLGEVVPLRFPADAAAATTTATASTRRARAARRLLRATEETAC